MKTYCVYLTIYAGNKLPPFYIGSSYVEKIEAGYRGSVQSKRFGKTWKKELEDHPELFRVKIISIHSSREEAYLKEEKLQVALNVVKNSLYVNCTIAYRAFRPPDSVSDETRRKMSLGQKKREPFSSETRKKLSFLKKGDLNPMKDPETRKRVGNTVRKLHADGVVYANFDTPESREKKRVSKLGSKNPMFGKKEAADHFHALEYECSRCHRLMNKGNWIRWHEEKCKSLQQRP